MSLSKALAIMWSRKLTALITFLVVFGSVFALCIHAPQLFQSETMLLISDAKMQQNQFPEILRYRINSQVYVIESDSLLRSAIVSLGTSSVYPDLGDSPDAETTAVLRAKRALGISVEKDSQVLRLTFRHGEPDMARRFLATVTELYLKRQAELSGNAEAPEFFRQQAPQYRRAYDRASHALTTFSEAHSTYSVKQEIELALARRDKAVSALDSTIGAIREKEGQIATLQDTIAHLRRKIALQDDSGRSKSSPAIPNTPDMTKLSETLNNEPPLLLVRVFQEAAQTLVNTNSAIAGLRALQKTQVNQLELLESELKRLASIEADFDRLKREVDMAAAILDAHYKRTAEAQMNADLDSSEKLSSARVLQTATTPFRPVFPQVSLFLALGAIVAVMSAAAACLAPELLSRTDSVQPSQPIRGQHMEETFADLARSADSLKLRSSFHAESNPHHHRPRPMVASLASSQTTA